MRPFLTGLLAAVLLAGCGGSGSSEPSSSTPAATETGATETTAAEPPLADPELFAYDAGDSTDVRVKKTVSRRGVDVSDVVIEAPERRVAAYLVAPHGKGDGAAVLFLHWLASEPTSNRSEFLDEARSLAKEGVVSLLPEQLFPWHEPPSDPEHDREMVVRQVVELRRALDVLAAQPGVDPARIGVVGHDYGGMYGSLLAAFDKRPATYVVMAADTDFPNWFVKYFVKSGRVDAYKAAFAGLDPVDAVAEAAPASVFLQFAESDSYVPYYRADELFEATSEPKKMEKYDGGHELDEAARKDRVAWLREQLQIGS